jgi:hypothetical protein
MVHIFDVEAEIFERISMFRAKEASYTLPTLGSIPPMTSN